MKAFLTYSIIFVLLQYFVTGNVFIDKTVSDKGQLAHNISGPYSFTKGNPDPYVLPIEQNGRINFQYAQRIKLLSVEWEKPEISSGILRLLQIFNILLSGKIPNPFLPIFSIVTFGFDSPMITAI